MDLTTHASLSPIRRGLQKGCTRRAAASDKVYQLLANGRWFSPGTPASSTTKTGRHDIAEILLKVALKHQKSINQSIILFDAEYFCMNARLNNGPLIFVLQKIILIHFLAFKYFDLTQVIRETRPIYYIRYLRFYAVVSAFI